MFKKLLGLKEDGKTSVDWYDPMDGEDEMIEMFTILGKTNEVADEIDIIHDRGPEKHWWMTCFTLGFRDRDDKLVLGVWLKFKETENWAEKLVGYSHAKAFEKEAIRKGMSEVQRDGDAVSFIWR
jgi:hypothetical protein